MKHSSETTAIYGGAFNPPTLAHAKVVSEVLKRKIANHIILSPSGEREDKDFGIAPESRGQLIKVFIKVMQSEGANVSLDSYFFDGKNKGLTTTAAEEEYFKKKLGVSPTFIFGSDVASAMPTWSNNHERFIEEKLKKIFIHRPGSSFDFQKNGFQNFTFLDIPDMLNISSSLAREMIRNKQSVKGILHPEIIREIEENNLYT